MYKIILLINVEGLKQGLKKGSKVVIDVDKDGTPFDFFWFNRLKDSKIDNCVTIIQEENNNEQSNRKKRG